MWIYIFKIGLKTEYIQHRLSIIKFKDKYSNTATLINCFFDMSVGLLKNALSITVFRLTISISETHD